MILPEGLLNMPPFHLHFVVLMYWATSWLPDFLLTYRLWPTNQSSVCIQGSFPRNFTVYSRCFRSRVYQASQSYTGLHLIILLEIQILLLILTPTDFYADFRVIKVYLAFPILSLISSPSPSPSPLPYHLPTYL